MATPVEQKPVNAISAVLARVETVLIAVSGAALAAIMLVVVADVVMRYAFNAPLTWSYNLIGLYLVGAVFFLALPDTMQHHGHIALDIFSPMFPLRLRHVVLCLGFAASTVFLALIAWLEWGTTATAYAGNDVLTGPVAFKTWVAHAVLTLGIGVLTLRTLYRTVFHAASAVAGRDLVEMPPPPITSTYEEHTAEHGA